MEDTTSPKPAPHQPDPQENKLRPLSLEQYVGQEEIKGNLKVFIEAAKKRGHPLDHVLLSGPPGLGKTTLAHILAREMGSGIRSTSGPVLERAGDMAAILTNLSPGEVLFIDEIHRLPRVVEEILYSAMEDFKLDIVVGQGPMARTVKVDLPDFTLLGATTRMGMLTSPLRDRFGIAFRLGFYTPQDLKIITQRSADILGVEITPEAAAELAKRARGTPRVVNRLLRRMRDFADEMNDGHLSLELVQLGLKRMGVDPLGLDPLHLEILDVIVNRFEGGPVGLSTLTAAINEPKDTIEEVYEPFLIQEGFLQKTPRGRMATNKAFEHLGHTPHTNQIPLPLKKTT